jgi:tRNA pseudouridine38-40 synthase
LAPAAALRTFSIEVAYDGADFAGWQIQPGRRTVQGELGALCGRILDQPLSLTGAGRTDAGVHALASLCSFSAVTPRRAGELWHGLRRLAPVDLLVRRVDERPAGFSARFSARARQYLYRMVRGADPFRRRNAWCTGHRLEADRMREALAPLAGRRDCRGLCVATSLPAAAWCEFQLAELTERDDELIFRVRCDRFLHSMVRSLAGTLHDVGRGRLGPEVMAEILARGDRSLCGVVAPPQGLHLERVVYEDFATGGPVGWSCREDGAAATGDPSASIGGHASETKRKVKSE